MSVQLLFFLMKMKTGSLFLAALLFSLAFFFSLFFVFAGGLILELNTKAT